MPHTATATSTSLAGEGLLASPQSMLLLQGLFFTNFHNGQPVGRHTFHAQPTPKASQRRTLQYVSSQYRTYASFWFWPKSCFARSAFEHHSMFATLSKMQSELHLIAAFTHQQLMRRRIWADILVQSPILHVDCMQGADVVRTRYAKACPQGAHFQAQALQLKQRWLIAVTAALNAHKVLSML